MVVNHHHEPLVFTTNHPIIISRRNPTEDINIEGGLPISPTCQAAECPSSKSLVAENRNET